MKNAVRNWHCRNCGKSNSTEIELDGKVKCAFCNWVMRIQPSRERGGETAGQMSRRPATRTR
jgi:rubredoxin